LSAIAENEYGVCEECGRQIHPDRLAVLPDARTCIRCAKKRESE
jgi:RNA polymerase-binding transcription factor DksA